MTRAPIRQTLLRDSRYAQHVILKALDCTIYAASEMIAQLGLSVCEIVQFYSGVVCPCLTIAMASL